MPSRQINDFSQKKKQKKIELVARPATTQLTLKNIMAALKGARDETSGSELNPTPYKLATVLRQPVFDILTQNDRFVKVEWQGIGDCWTLIENARLLLKEWQENFSGQPCNFKVFLPSSHSPPDPQQV